jgi:hypothetical protein
VIVGKVIVGKVIATPQVITIFGAHFVQNVI